MFVSKRIRKEVRNKVSYIVTPYAQFLNKKLYLIESYTSCLFRENCDENKMKESLKEIRKIFKEYGDDEEELKKILKKYGYSNDDLEDFCKYFYKYYRENRYKESEPEKQKKAWRYYDLLNEILTYTTGVSHSNKIKETNPLDENYDELTDKTEDMLIYLCFMENF